jgi:anhydro-N-acetylmuramic acid kinase
MHSAGGGRYTVAMPNPRIIAGAMSGTSADGVDIAIVRIEGRGLEMSARLLQHHHIPYDAAARAAIFDCRNRSEISLSTLAELGRSISLTYADAINQSLKLAAMTSEDLTAIAAHGQTLFHDPPNTIQWLDPALIAAETHCVVISDFRRADCAAGGQGAPLVPFADHILFSDPLRHRVLLNLGGIANVTYLPAAGNIDFLMRHMNPEGPGVDLDGTLASHGAPDETIVLKMLSDRFFKKSPPKSTDGPAMIDVFTHTIEDFGSRGKLPGNLATACLVTATSIVRAMREFLPHFPDEVIASGGGVHNQAIMTYLRKQLPGVPLKTTDELGILSEAKEAIAFALLGAATLDGVAGNVISATGARRGVVLGSVTPRPEC